MVVTALETLQNSRSSLAPRLDIGSRLPTKPNYAKKRSALAKKFGLGKKARSKGQREASV